jgi:signal transduction histidine kinase
MIGIRDRACKQVALVNLHVESKAQGWQIDDVFDAALLTLINDRCRRAYVHDIRGRLQAVYSSFELLARSARQGAVNGTLIDNASALAKRALASHERVMLEIVNQLTVPEDEPVVVNVANLIDEIQQFLRNDAASRDIRISVSGDKNVRVSAALNKLRTLLLALLALSIDALPAGAELQIDISRVREDACMELRSELSFGEIRSAAALLRDQAGVVQPRDLILVSAQHWLQKHGGGIVVDRGATLHNVLRIYHPLIAE